MGITNQPKRFRNNRGKEKDFLDLVEEYGLEDVDEIVLSKDVNSGWYYFDVPEGFDDIYRRYCLEDWKLIQEEK